MRYPRAILVSCELPWDEQENLIEELFRAEVRRFLGFGFRHIYIFGTAGEGYAVDTARFQRTVEVFFEETRASDVVPQIGIIGLSTANVQERISIAYKIGFRFFQLSLPPWGVLNDQEVLRFFQDVCLGHLDCQFLHYNLLRAKRLLTGADYRPIADEIPNLVATKNTNPDVTHTVSLLNTVPELQHFLGEATFPVGCSLGECSLLASFAGLFPKKTAMLFEYACAGKFEALSRLHTEYLTAMEEILGPMKRRSLMDGAYDKVLVRLGGAQMPLRLLSPYDAFSEEIYLECKRIVDEKYGSWLGLAASKGR